ncbi:MAG: 23S rRNA (uracil(1939)-C(5))-methyltransferase RlmD [Bacteroidales bacterium]|nr:23S rRNA (uracil(1939)-C(5))-methyltransferase RlmD [Bacteroidales bacterium]
MRKTRQEIILEDVTIADAGAEGKAVARVDGMVVFVPFVVPGDVVDIKVFKKKKNYAEGKAVALKQPSPLRREAQCPHFGLCGGCKWQTTDYAAQLRFKQQQVKDNLERLGHIDTSTMHDICGSDNLFYYRNKLEFTFSTKRWLNDGETRSDDDPGALGFHIPTVFDKVLPIEHCALQRDPSNRIRLAVRDYALQHQLPFYDIRNHTGFLRNLVLRNTAAGEWMVIVVVAEERPEWLMPLLDYLKATFPEISSLQYIVNSKMNDSYTDLEVVTYSGSAFITETMPRYGGGTPLQFRIGPKSFYQTNSEQAYKLYSYAADFAKLTGEETLYDLYTGTGTIAQFVAARCHKVVGIEYVEDAIEDARKNAKINGFDNCEFFAGDMAKVLTADFIAEHGRPDVVITDPPRAGMHESVVQQLLAAAPRRIVYVSCNPATQARDLAMLCSRYRVTQIQPVDMFPHTQHVENVVALELLP